jgi:hypothetical protein
MRRHVLVGGFVCLSVSGVATVDCGSSPAGSVEAGPATPTFTDVYTEILHTSCGTTSATTTAGCHQAAADVPPSSLAMSNLDMSSQAIAYQNLVNVRGMGTYCSAPGDGGVLAPFRVLPGNAQESLLYLKVEDVVPPCGGRMPRPIPPATSVTPLSDAQISLIQGWINAGAMNN